MCLGVSDNALLLGPELLPLLIILCHFLLRLIQLHDAILLPAVVLLPIEAVFVRQSSFVSSSVKEMQLELIHEDPAMLSSMCLLEPLV